MFEQASRREKRKGTPSPHFSFTVGDLCAGIVKLCYVKVYFEFFFSRLVATLETRKRLGRVIFRKDFWECYEGQDKQIGQ